MFIYLLVQHQNVLEELLFNKLFFFNGEEQDLI